MVDGLIRLGGGVTGKQAGDEANPVILFAFGDSVNFQPTSSGLPSLDSKFSSYAAYRLRSMGHIVIGIDEWGTS